MTKKQKKPSIQLLMVYKAVVSTADQWSSVEKIAELAKVNIGTTGKHLRYLANNGVVDTVIAHPAHYYKLSTTSSKLLKELQALTEVFIES